MTFPWGGEYKDVFKGLVDCTPVKMDDSHGGNAIVVQTETANRFSLWQLHAASHSTVQRKLSRINNRTSLTW